MATFALVHGAWHGAWCWDRLIPELEAHGQAAIAVELPCEDPDAGCAAYCEIVLAQTAGVGDDLVLVGHSLGGLTIPLVAAARPVRKLVFLCALLPRPGLSLIDQLQQEPEIFTPGFGAGVARDELGRSYWPDEDEAIDVFYPDSPRQLASWAAARLRHQARAPNTEPCPLTHWPALESVSLFASEDAAVNPHWSRIAARERLGANTVELPGDHSPFLGRPAELAEALVSVSL
jgi:pimeloyl-ACP methyl ester carboxylesterase